MKRVIVNSVNNNPSIYTVRDAIIRFLKKNGATLNITDAIMIYDDNTIEMAFDYANSNYTRAIALLQLIFSADEAPAYIRYQSKENMRLCIRRNSTFQEVVDYIERHMDITIE